MGWQHAFQQAFIELVHVPFKACSNYQQEIFFKENKNWQLSTRKFVSFQEAS